MSYIGNTPTQQNFVAGADQFSGNGSTVAFTLSRSVNTVFDIFVTVANVPQDPFTAYTVAGNTLTFDGAPPSGTNNIDVVYRATNVQTFVPSPGVAVQFGLGSASAPSLTFIGDTNTGIYSPTADTLAFATAGTEDFRFGPVGQLGIGGANYGTAGQVLTSGGPSAAPSWAASGVFPSGTAMLFVQTAAPTGWTKSTTHDNKALRVVSGTASSGGSVAFTTAFASQSVAGTVGSTTLATSQIPGHDHQSGIGRAASGSANGLIRSVANSVAVAQFGIASGNIAFEALSTTTGGGGSHNHSFTGTAIDLAVQYVDVIIATKD